jgi:hypothetical protein
MYTGKCSFLIKLACTLFGLSGVVQCYWVDSTCLFFLTLGPIEVLNVLGTFLYLLCLSLNQLVVGERLFQMGTYISIQPLSIHCDAIHHRKGWFSVSEAMGSMFLSLSQFIWNLTLNARVLKVIVLRRLLSHENSVFMSRIKSLY